MLLANLTTAAELSVAVARTPLSLPIFVAAEQGYFRNEGLDVQLHEVSGGHRAIEAVLAGQVDAGFVRTGIIESFKVKGGSTRRSSR